SVIHPARGTDVPVDDAAKERPTTSSGTSAEQPIVLFARQDGREPPVFRQGPHPPFGIRWYGITSLFGHLRNFVARAIASESVDSRDWMRPNPPDEMIAAASRVLLAHQPAPQAPGRPRAPPAPPPTGTTLVDIL